jgi:hypothetical protein
MLFKTHYPARIGLRSLASSNSELTSENMNHIHSWMDSCEGERARHDNTNTERRGHTFMTLVGFEHTIPV